MKYLLLIILFSQNVFALDPLELSEEEKNPDTQDVLIKQPEKYLRHDSMIYDLNTDLGIKDQRKYTGNDNHKFSVAGHIAADYEHLSDILGIEFSYMFRTKKYNRIWYGLQFFQHRTYFDAITQNQAPEPGDNANDESQFQRPNNVKNNVFAGGLGVGYRFKLLLEFFDTEDVFETIDVFANFLTLDETYIDRKYKGYGLTTNYSIHKRSSTRFFYGGKLSYNIATVTREAIGDESKSDRSFAIGWLSLALEMGFYF
ncbi:MAG: hypothetical protein H0V66_05700 [Bdellovibrionales bacterium]|nr:hypothetical protein [Bdellovibrionales bacterium]